MFSSTFQHSAGMQRLSTNIEDLISNYIKAEINNANQNRLSILLGSDERLTELKSDEFLEPSKHTAPLSPCQPFKLTESPAMTEFALSMNDKTVEEIGPNPILFPIMAPPIPM